MSQQNNSNNNQSQQQRPTNPFQRTANSSSNNQNSGNNQQQQNSNPSSNGLGQFTPPNRKTWTTLPAHKVAVRFELAGLGDPFYRLLGHELNTDYGNAQVVARMLETGGEHVEALTMILDNTWKSYNLTGAALVYGWHVNSWQTIAQPTPIPTVQNDELFTDDDSADDKAPEPDKQPPFKVIRAIDLSLVLNVLARARSQVVLMTAPLVFNQTYLNRKLITDDPRLVQLARATGYLEESHV